MSNYQTDMNNKNIFSDLSTLERWDEDVSTSVQPEHVLDPNIKHQALLNARHALTEICLRDIVTQKQSIQEDLEKDNNYLMKGTLYDVCEQGNEIIGTFDGHNFTFDCDRILMHVLFQRNLLRLAKEMLPLGWFKFLIGSKHNYGKFFMKITREDPIKKNLSDSKSKIKIKSNNDNI